MEILMLVLLDNERFGDHSGLVLVILRAQF